MAKPDTDDGWTPLAHELLVAVFCAKIPYEARAVLSVVFLQIYGPAKLKSATIDAAGLARATGIKRPNIWRGVTFLVQNHMLQQLPDGSYKFLKDHAKWGSPGEPILSPELGTFSTLAPALAKSFRYASELTKNADATNAMPEIERIPQDTVLAEVNGSSVSHRIRAPYPTGYAERIPQDTRIPISENEKENAKHITATGGNGIVSESATPPTTTTILKPIPDGPPDPKAEPPYPVDSAMDIGSAGSHTLTDEEARGVFSKLWKAWGNRELCMGFYRRQRMHSAATWREAIDRFVEKRFVPFSISLIDRKAGEIEVEPQTPTPTVRQAAPRTVSESPSRLRRREYVAEIERLKAEQKAKENGDGHG